MGNFKSEIIREDEYPVVNPEFIMPSKNLA